VNNLKENIGKREKEGRSSLGRNKVPALEAEIKTRSDQVQGMIQREYEKRGAAEKLRSEYEQARESLEGGNLTDKVSKSFALDWGS